MTTPYGLTPEQLAAVPNANISKVAGLTPGSHIGAMIAGALASGGTSFLVQAGLSLALGAVSELFHRKPRLIRRRILQRNLADPSTYLPVIYGAQKVGINRTFVTSTGPTAGDKRFLWVAGAICHGPIAGIDEIYIDGKLAVETTNNGHFDSDASEDFSQYVTAWKAYGTEGQLMYHPRSNPRSTTANSWKDNNNRYVDFTSSHGYVVGDTISISGVSSGITAGVYFVSEVTSSTRVAIGYPQGGSLTSFTSTGGTSDYYNPDLPTELTPLWTADMRGAGIAYVLLRLVWNELRYPNGIPEITVNVRGTVVEDPRSLVTGSITSSATSAGIPRHTAAVVVTTGAVHGLVAGDTVLLTGHTTASGINGTHRIYDVPSSTTFRIPVAYAANGTGGTWQKLSYSTTPALCIRDFLLNPIYGVKAATSEIDDTAFSAEATYHETVTDTPVENSSSFTNLRRVQQIVVSGGVATVTTTQVDPPYAVTPHGYTTGQVALFSNMATAAGGAFNNHKFTITSTPTSSTFTFATVVANGTYSGDVRDSVTGTRSGDNAVNVQQARVRAVTTGTLYTCNGALDPAQSVQQSIEDLLTSCRGILVYQSGKFRLTTPRAASPISYTLNDDTIVGDVTLTLPGAEDVANVVVATFPNALSGYVLDTVSWPVSNDYNDLLAADNLQFLRKEIDLPFTSQRAIAQQIAMVLRRESRARMLSCVAFESAMVAQVGDIVPVTREVYGFSAKPFRVLSISPRPDDHVELSLIEHDDTWYNLEPNDDVTYYASTTLVPYVPGIENVVVKDWRNVGINLPAGVGALDYSLSLGYTLLGGNVSRIDITAHTLRVPTSDYTYVDISYPAGTVSTTGSDATTRNIPWYVYIDDPTYSGTGSYGASTTMNVASTGSGRRYLGTITLPSGTSGSDSTAGTPFSRSKA